MLGAPFHASPADLSSPPSDWFNFDALDDSGPILPRLPSAQLAVAKSSQLPKAAPSPFSQDPASLPFSSMPTTLQHTQKHLHLLGNMPSSGAPLPAEMLHMHQMWQLHQAQQMQQAYQLHQMQCMQQMHGGFFGSAQARALWAGGSGGGGAMGSMGGPARTFRNPFAAQKPRVRRSECGQCPCMFTWMPLRASVHPICMFCMFVCISK